MRWDETRRGETFYKKAKELGYRSRAAFKLLEIQEKFHIIKQGNCILDLGAAPGSWSQIALNLVGGKGTVVGNDIQPVVGLGDKYQFLRGDILKESVFERIAKLGLDFDVVLSDTAPDTSGFKDVDIGVACLLANSSLEIAKKFLRPGGNFACKIFQGKGFDDFLKAVKKNFRRVEIFKPRSSQKNSAEIFIVGIGKL